MSKPQTTIDLLSAYRGPGRWVPIRLLLCEPSGQGEAVLVEPGQSQTSEPLRVLVLRCPKCGARYAQRVTLTAPRSSRCRGCEQRERTGRQRTRRPWA